MSKSRKTKSKNPNAFSLDRPPKYEFGRQWPKRKVPIVSAMATMRDTLFAIDSMIAVCLVERDYQVEVVRHYRDKGGKAYQKAQKAALKADEMTDRANTLRDLKLGLFGRFARIWTKYSGDPAKGVVASLWLVKAMRPEDIAKKTGKSVAFVVDALFELRCVFANLLFAQAKPFAYGRIIIDEWTSMWCGDDGDKENRR